jgi:hypothetical protein
MPRAILSLAALLAVLLGCSANVLPAPGQVMLVLATDMTPGRDFDTVVVRVADPSLTDDLFYDWRFRSIGGGRFEGDLQLPSTLALVRRSSGSGAVTTVRVEARLGGVPRVVREARVVIPASGVQMLRMSLDWLCWDMVPAGTQAAANALVCEEGSACASGACASSGADPGALAPWDEAMVFGDRGTGTLSASCFQVLGCFTRGALVEPRLDSAGTCGFPYAGPADTLNVAIALPPSAQRGFCAKDACVVPLDKGTAGGWRLDAGRVVVPRRVCTDARSVAVSTACASKVETTPPCAEWSSVGGSSAGANDEALSLDLRDAGTP